MKVTLPPVLLRIEGTTLLVLSALLYGLNGGSWLLFVLLFLVPDVSMLGYLSETRVEATSYNLFHIYAAPGLLAVLGLLAESPPVVCVALVSFAHIGIRSDGWLWAEVPYGVSYTTHKRTHPNTRSRKIAGMPRS